MKKQFTLKKQLLAILTLIICLWTSITPAYAAAARIDARAALMVDADTGQIIYAQNADQPLPIASITKLLTIAVIHDELQQRALTPYTKVKISPEVAAISNNPNYSSIGLMSGQSYPVVELVNAAMVKSADGAVAALAMAHGDSMDEFVLKMEQKAQQIGLKTAKIVNPTGLTNGDMGDLRSDNVPADAENEMSAKDVAQLSSYLIHTYPAILQVTAQKKANFLISKGNVKSVDNLNKMLPGQQYTVPGVKIRGLKTGTSDRAGASFVSEGTYRGHQIITVVLHANGDNPDNRFVQTQNLYRMLQHDYRLTTVKVPHTMTTVKLTAGAQGTVTTTPQTLTVWRQAPLKSYTIAQSLDHQVAKHPQTMPAPVKQGQHLGHLRLTSPDLKTISGEPLTYPLVSTETVPRGNFLTRLFAH